MRAVHFGGGSPTILKPYDILALGKALRDRFDLCPDASFSVEIESRDIDEARLNALGAIGMTRASLSVQDFHPKVQKAINREQSFRLTKSVVDGVRARGVNRLILTCSTDCRTRRLKRRRDSRARLDAGARQGCGVRPCSCAVGQEAANDD